MSDRQYACIQTYVTFWGAGASAVKKIKQGHNTEDDPGVGWVEATLGKVIRRLPPGITGRLTMRHRDLGEGCSRQRSSECKDPVMERAYACGTEGRPVGRSKCGERCR